MARAERGGHDRQHVGQLLAELLGARRSARAQHDRGTRRRTPATPARARELRRSASRQAAPNRAPQPPVATTNSPDRRLTPAASSSASSRSLNPRASANRVPNFVTLSGIQPPAAARSMADCVGLLARLDHGAPCASRDLGPACVARLAVPNRNHARQERGDADAERRSRSRAGSSAPEGATAHQTPFGSKREQLGLDVHPALGQLVQELRPQPVDFRRPRNLPSSSTPAEKSNRKMSCRVMTSPSMPATSVTCVKRRRAVLQPRLVHDQLDRRGDLLADRPCGDSSIPAIIVIVSSRESASRGQLQWIVEIEPS